MRAEPWHSIKLMRAGRQGNSTAPLADVSLQASSSADVSRSAPFLLSPKDPDTIGGTIWI
jgi:hypothetical protein